MVAGSFEETEEEGYDSGHAEGAHGNNDDGFDSASSVAAGVVGRRGSNVLAASAAALGLDSLSKPPLPVASYTTPNTGSGGTVGAPLGSNTRRGGGEGLAAQMRDSFGSGITAMNGADSDSCRVTTPALGTFLPGPERLSRSASSHKLCGATGMSVGALSDPTATRVPTAASSASAIPLVGATSPPDAGLMAEAAGVAAEAPAAAEAAAVGGGRNPTMPTLSKGLFTTASPTQPSHSLAHGAWASAGSGSSGCSSGRVLPDPRASPPYLHPTQPATDTRTLTAAGSTISLGWDEGAEGMWFQHKASGASGAAPRAHTAFHTAHLSRSGRGSAPIPSAGSSSTSAAPSAAATVSTPTKGSKATRPGTAGQGSASLTAEDIIALAYMDCTDDSAGGLGDLWSTLLPLAGTSHNLQRGGSGSVAAGLGGVGGRGAAGGDTGAALDLFAY